MWITSYDVDCMQRLLGALETFCQSSELTVSVHKTKRWFWVSMYLPQINGAYALSLDFKLVGKVII